MKFSFTLVCRFDYPVADNDAHETYSVCSDMGSCDPITGTCTCRQNFFVSFNLTLVMKV
jgi:hypothetical protein